MTTALSIGSSSGAITALSSLSTPVRDPSTLVFYDQNKIERTGDGTDIAIGAAYVVMVWPFIYRLQRDMLRTFCTGPSATTYWWLPKNDSNLTWASYKAIMHWPNSETYRSNYLTSFSITLSNLVAL